MSSARRSACGGGVRAAAGYMAPMRSTADLNGNDMAQLVTGRLGALSLTLTAGLVAPTGMVPADLLRFHVRTPASALPTNAGNPTLAAGRSRAPRSFTPTTPPNLALPPTRLNAHRTAPTPARPKAPYPPTSSPRYLAQRGSPG